MPRAVTHERSTKDSSILERFSQVAVFAASLLNEGENKYDCERYDLLRHAHLPKVDRTKAQMQLGVSEQSEQEHPAARLVYLDVHDQKEVPDRFDYIGQSWLFMYRAEIYSQEEYADFLKQHPGENLLMTSLGMVSIDLDEPDRHLAWIKNENAASRLRKRRSSRNVQRHNKKQSGRQRKLRHLATLLPSAALLAQLPNLLSQLRPQREPQAARASHLLRGVWKLESGRSGTDDGTRKSSDTDVRNGKAV